MSDELKSKEPEREGHGLVVRYMTKSGEEIMYWDHRYAGQGFDTWYMDKISHEGMFPTHGGRISPDAVLRIEVVEEW